MVHAAPFDSAARTNLILKSKIMDEKQTMMLGVHRFLFYQWNFISVRNENDGEWYPTVIMKAEWTCNSQHICDKYMKCLDSVGSNYALAHLYGDLDNENRRIMLEWIMSNEPHAPKLF